MDRSDHPRIGLVQHQAAIELLKHDDPFFYLLLAHVRDVDALDSDDAFVTDLVSDIQGF
jgi:hypothetical protein